ncbi:MAG: glycoside hydrolase family 1 protein [Patescibacteria group bacterium]
MSDKIQFPKGFYWGAATSAHQVEGNNHNDWSEWEKENAERLAREAKNKWQKWQQEKFPEMFEPENYISDRACDHYNRYEEDFDIAKSLGHNAHRFSIEWSRIEPEEGKFNEDEIEHYRKVIKALRERGIEPFVTLWHWTIPLWVRDKGGVANKYFSEYFSRYAERMAQKLADIKFWITLNEPTAVIAMAYTKGDWPPQKRNPITALKVYKTLAQAHNEAYKKIHAVSPEARVGFVNILSYIEPHNKNSLFDKLTARIAKYFSNEKFLNLTNNNNDFLAIDYYFHNRLKFPGKLKNEKKEVSDMGWELYPEGIFHVLSDLKKYKKPIYITENGLADAEDARREWFIKESLRNVFRAISEGVDVRGYLYWSLLDNFEWDKGFWPRFGLVEIDYSAKGESASGGKMMERKIRPSAYEYAKICKNNGLD